MTIECSPTSPEEKLEAWCTEYQQLYRLPMAGANTVSVQTARECVANVCG